MKLKRELFTNSKGTKIVKITKYIFFKKENSLLSREFMKASSTTNLGNKYDCSNF